MIDQSFVFYIPNQKLVSHKTLKNHFLQNTKEFIKEQAKKKTNIVKILSIFEQKENLFIVFEFCEGGNLFEYIKSKEGGLEEFEVVSRLHQLGNAIFNLYSQKRNFLNLTPYSILFSNTEKDAVLKIFDFGNFNFLKSVLFKDEFDLFYSAPEFSQK